MGSTYGELLHPEFFQTPFGEGARKELQDEVTFFASEVLLTDPAPPAISVVVQSCNDTPAQIHRLFDDIDRQQYPADSVQRIVVSGGNSPETLRAARERQAIVREIPRLWGFRASILNEGLATADNELVYTTIGHACLSNDLLLRAAAYHGVQNEVIAAYSTVLPGKQASFTERAGARLLGAYGILRDGPVIVDKPGLGLLTADSSVVKDIGVGKYDTAYGFGGADGEMGKKILRTQATRQRLGFPYRIVREPLMAVHHTHGFGPVQSLRQYLTWLRMGNSKEYKSAEWVWHPNGGL